MPEDDDAINPYDFRTPVRDPELLVGRDRELHDIDQHLKSTASGRPVHVALIGERAAGKTSVLNVAACQAEKEWDLVPVRLDCDAAVVASPFTFFKAFFESAVHALVGARAIVTDDPSYEAWLRQVHLGDTEVRIKDQLLLFGMLAARGAGQEEHPDVTPALLKQDVECLAGIALKAGKKGMALFIDEGDLIGQHPALIQKLRNLFQATSSWMFVAAGTRTMFDGLSEVFSPIPRQFVRIDVEAFTSYAQVMRCILVPLKKHGLARDDIHPSPQQVADIQRITSGRPYEINLVCHYIWQVLNEGDQKEFALSADILDAVISELRDLGRQTSLVEIDAIRRLSETDLEVAADIVPYQGYTPEEVARCLLFPADFSEEEFEVTLRRVRGGIRDLSDVGIVHLERGRIRMVGDSFVRVYLKYVIALRTGHAANERGGYAADLSLKLSGLVAKELFGDQNVLFYHHQKPHELGDSEIGKSLVQFVNALRAKDLLCVADSALIPPGILREFTDELWEEPREELVLFGWVLGSSVDLIEHGTLLFNRDERPAAEMTKVAQEFVQNLRPLFSKYELEFSQAFFAHTEWSVVTKAMCLDARHIASTRSFGKVLAKDFEGAATTVEEVLVVLNEIKNSRSLSPRNLEEMADMSNVAGFCRAARKEWDLAEHHLAAALALDQKEVWLRKTNLAYVRANRNNFEEAVTLLDEALSELETVPPHDLILLAYFPGSNPEQMPDEWSLVKLAGEHVRQFLELQRAIYGVASGSSTVDQLRTQLASASPGMNPALDRLAAWSFMTYGNEQELVRAHLEAAESSESDFGGVTQDRKILL